MLKFETILEMKPFPGTVAAYSPGTKMPSPFAFVLNISEIVGCDAVEIIPGRIMRRANEAEVKFIKELLGSSFFGTTPVGTFGKRVNRNQVQANS